MKWQPASTAPKDREILVYSNRGYEIVKWRTNCVNWCGTKIVDLYVQVCPACETCDAICDIHFDYWIDLPKFSLDEVEK